MDLEAEMGKILEDAEAAPTKGSRGGLFTHACFARARIRNILSRAAQESAVGQLFGCLADWLGHMDRPSVAAGGWLVQQDRRSRPSRLAGCPGSAS